MGRTILNPMDVKEELVKELSEAFGGNLLSAVIHGLAATPRYVPGKSDINVILVVKDDSVQAMAPLNGLEKKWASRKIIFSFFFTPSYIQASLDAYPMEFMEMKRDHLLLYGTDYFKELVIDPGLLRLQCERELKGKLLHLKREYIRWSHRKKALKELLDVSFSQFLIVFRNIELCGGIEETLGMKGRVLKSIAAGEEVPFPEYIAAIEAACSAVDRMMERQ